ncbi:CocE/NonD family hydrolase [Halostagnicola bangensis]
MHSDSHTRLRRRRLLLLLGAGATTGIAGCFESEETADDPLNGRTETDVMVEMRDGVELATDIYRPSDDGEYPTLLMRTPYDKTEEGVPGGTEAAVENGFTVVLQDVRGRFGSEGTFDPFVFEADDGYDTIDWIAKQSWNDGQVGMLGSSYVGMTTWQAALAEPPALEAIAPTITPGDYYEHIKYPGGAFELASAFGWTIQVTFQGLEGGQIEDADPEAIGTFTEEIAENPMEYMEYRPLEEIPSFDELAPYWRDWHEHSTYDEFWAGLDVTEGIDDVDIPVLHAGGWYDIFLTGHTDVYRAIQEDGGERIRDNHHMVIGPWDHMTFGTSETEVGDRDFGEQSAATMVSERILPWFDHHLKGKETEAASYPDVEYFQMGDNEWREDSRWPPAHEPTTHFLTSDGEANSRHGDGKLVDSSTKSGTTADTYEYDPLDPVPSVGGPVLNPEAVPPGVRNQSAVEERSDVLVYTSEKLVESVSIAGPVSVALSASSSAPDTDFTAKLVDVEPDGYAANITEGVVRARYRDSLAEPSFMTPGTVYELDIDLWPTAHTFAEGHRIRLEVSSSNFPRFDRNPNTDIEEISKATEDDVQRATQQVFHDEDRRSCLVLPVVD